MAPLEIHLAGPGASVSTQTSLVRNVQEDVGRRQMDLLSLIAGIVLQKRQLTDTDREGFVQRRMSIGFVKQNLRTLREEWAKVGVRAVFPERVVNEKLTQAEKLIDQCMDEDGVTTDEFEQTLAADAVDSLEVGAAATELESGSPTVASTLGQAQQTDLGTLVIKSLSELTGLFEDEEYQKLPSRPGRTSLPVRRTPTDGNGQADRRRRSALPQSIGRERRISVAEKKRSGNLPSALQVVACDRGGGGGDDDDPDDPRRDRGGGRSRDPSGPNRRGQRYTPQLDPPSLIRQFDRKLYWEIPSFTGDYLDFPEFFDLFRLVVHNTDLPEALKLNFLRLKLDSRTRRMILSYRGHDYLRAFQAIADEYSSLASVVAHVRRRAHALPHVTQRDDLEGLVEVVEQLRAINSLFSHYDLSMGLEMEIFRIFLTKLPELFSDRYLREMHNDTPSLAIYLEYLDSAVMAVRTRKLWLPYHRPEEDRFSTGGDLASDFPAFASEQRWVNHADWRDLYQDQNPVEESQCYVEEAETDQEDSAIEWHSRPQLTAYACSQKSDSVSLQQPGHTRPQRSIEAPPRSLNDQPHRAIAWYTQEKEGPSRAIVSYDRPIRFPCLTCGAPDHSSLCCESVSLEEKHRLVKLFRLCCLCLKRGHYSAACKSKLRCAKCGGRHHKQLCENSYPPREGNPSRPPHHQMNRVEAEQKVEGERKVEDEKKAEDEQETEEPGLGIRELFEGYSRKGSDSGSTDGRVLFTSSGGMSNGYIALPFTIGKTTPNSLPTTSFRVGLMPDEEVFTPNVLREPALIN